MQVFFYYSQRSQAEIKQSQDAIAKQKKNQPKPKRATLGKQISSYISAELKHAFRGAAAFGVYAKRKSICMACPRRLEELEGKRDEGGIGFCGACGCPASRRSQLSVKLTMAGVPCPLGKFGKESGTGGTITSAVQAAKGIAASVAQQLRKTLG